MITDLRGGTIWSEDPDNLLPFYRDLLGLPVTIQIPGVVALGDLAAPTLVLGTHSEVRGRNAGPARHVVGLASDDLDGDWKRLTGLASTSRDPDGLRPAAHRDPKNPEGT